jgi:AcrR family transcriptional regulator
MTEPAAASPGPEKARGGIRQMQREFTRSRLAEAAVEQFSSAGYVATTIDDITAAAGTTRATFYLHFKSKAEVALEVSRRLGEDYQPLYAALEDIVQSPSAESVRAWLDSTLATWERTQQASVALNQAALLEPVVEEERLASFERDIDRLAAALQRSGRWEAAPARVRAVLMFTQLEQLFVRWAAHGWDVDRAEILSVLSQMWCAALDVGPGAST